MNVWLLIAGCVAGTVVVKAAGPVLLGGRELPAAMIRVVALMAPALLAALVVTAAFADGRHLHVGAETVGMLAGGVLLWRGQVGGPRGARRRARHGGSARSRVNRSPVVQDDLGCGRGPEHARDASDRSARVTRPRSCPPRRCSSPARWRRVVRMLASPPAPSPTAAALVARTSSESTWVAVERSTSSARARRAPACPRSSSRTAPGRTCRRGRASSSRSSRPTVPAPMTEPDVGRSTAPPGDRTTQDQVEDLEATPARRRRHRADRARRTQPRGVEHDPLQRRGRALGGRGRPRRRGPARPRCAMARGAARPRPQARTRTSRRPGRSCRITRATHRSRRSASISRRARRSSRRRPGSARGPTEILWATKSGATEWPAELRRGPRRSAQRRVRRAAGATSRRSAEKPERHPCRQRPQHPGGATRSGESRRSAGSSRPCDGAPRRPAPARQVRGARGARRRPRDGRAAGAGPVVT